MLARCSQDALRTASRCSDATTPTGHLRTLCNTELGAVKPVFGWICRWHSMYSRREIGLDPSLTFSLRRSGARSVSSSCVAVRRCAALRYSFSSSGTIAGTFSRYLT